VIPVGVSHIATVITDPGRFGCRWEDIVACYRWCGESLGLEGKVKEVHVGASKRIGL